MLSERNLLVALVLLYLIVGVLYAVRTPAWQAPDEPAHYNYIAQVAANGCCPVIRMGDWNQVYQSRLTTYRFAPELLGELPTIQYEDHQPPLYYALASAVYTLTSGSLTGVRLLSVLIGVGVVLSAYGVGKTLLPHRPMIALGAAAFVAFLPQHLAVLSSVNNDGLAELIVGLTLLATLHFVRGQNPLLTPAAGWLLLFLVVAGVIIALQTVLAGLVTPIFDAPVLIAFGVALLLVAGVMQFVLSGDERAVWILGILVGLGLATKTTTYFMAGIVPLAILLRWMWSTPRPPLSALIRALLLFLIPALLLGSIWWVRNLRVYGVPDFLGLRQHDVVVADQVRRVEYIASFGLDAYWQRAVEFTFNSFWGQFGWMALPLPEWTYRLILGLLVIVGGGWVMATSTRTRTQQTNDAHTRLMWIVLALVVILTAAQYVYYNLEFLQHQGRYLFTALIPLGVVVALGLDGWSRLLFRRDTPFSPLVLLLFLIPLNLFIVWRLLPLLSP